MFGIVDRSGDLVQVEDGGEVQVGGEEGGEEPDAEDLVEGDVEDEVGGVVGCCLSATFFPPPPFPIPIRCIYRSKTRMDGKRHHQQRM